MSTNEVVRCPYNPEHKLYRCRLQAHLIKCSKQYPNVELQHCPFNLSHMLREADFALHVANCPDKQVLTRVLDEGPAEIVDTKQAPIETEENWDDTDVPDYNPNTYASKANIIRQPKGFCKSERRSFLKQERERLGVKIEDEQSGDEVKEEKKPTERYIVCDEYHNYTERRPGDKRRNRNREGRRREDHPYQRNVDPTDPWSYSAGPNDSYDNGQQPSTSRRKLRPAHYI